MQDYRKTLEHITKETLLAPSEQILLHGHVIAGHRVLCAGTATWHYQNRQMTRVTRQLEGCGLCMILDESDRYQELMSELSTYTQMLLDEGNKPEDFDRCIYVYTQDVEKQQHPRLHLFSRIMDKDGQLGV